MTIIKRPFFGTQIRKARVSQDVVNGEQGVILPPIDPPAFRRRW